MGEHAHNAN